MITTAQIYWLTRLDNIIDICGMIIFISVILIIGLSVAGAILRCKCQEYSWDTKESVAVSHATGKHLHKIARWLVVPLSISLSVGAFVPTTKEMAAIMIVPRLANSEKVQTVGNKVYDLAVEWLDALKPGKGKGGEK